VVIEASTAVKPPEKAKKASEVRKSVVSACPYILLIWRSPSLNPFLIWLGSLSFVSVGYQEHPHPHPPAAAPVRLAQSTNTNKFSILDDEDSDS